MVGEITCPWLGTLAIASPAVTVTLGPLPITASPAVTVENKGCRQRKREKKPKQGTVVCQS